MSNRFVAAVLLTLALTVLAACGGGSATSPPASSPVSPQAPLAPAGDPASLLSSAQTALSAGQLDTAIADFEASLAQAKSLDGYFGLGNAYTRQGKLPDAANAYNEALKINPNHVPTLSNLGVVYYQQAKLADARKTFERALAAKPDDAETHYLLGATLLQLNDTAAAEKSLLKALELKPALPEARFGLAMLRNMQGRKDEAIKEFETFLSGPPAQDPQARVEAERILKELKGQ